MVPLTIQLQTAVFRHINLLEVRGGSGPFEVLSPVLTDLLFGWPSPVLQHHFSDCPFLFLKSQFWAFQPSFGSVILRLSFSPASPNTEGAAAECFHGSFNEPDVVGSWISVWWDEVLWDMETQHCWADAASLCGSISGVILCFASAAPYRNRQLPQPSLPLLWTADHSDWSIPV